MTVAQCLTTMGLLMLKMHIEFVRCLYGSGWLRHNSSLHYTCDETGKGSVSITKHAYSATRDEPDAVTVELRLRPHPQSAFMTFMFQNGLKLP